MQDRELTEARQKLDKEFREVRESLGKVHIAYNEVMDPGPTDNLHDLLAELEKQVKAARDGGIIGSGANDHRRALKKYLELGGKP